MVTIEKITPFPTGEGSGVAAVKLACGPVVLHAKLRKRNDGKLFLDMPARKSAKEEKWFDHCYIADRDVHSQVEKQAVAQFEAISA